MPRNRATSPIFFRHVGATTRDVYLRVNPQAIRVQQGNKGSVVDTLGGYFREVLHSPNPERNGLMLPDLTIECETGVGYRDELAKIAWIWRHHADLKEDGTPADTYFLDFVDEDTLAFAGGIFSEDLQKASLKANVNSPSPPRLPTPLTAISQLAKLKPLSKSLGANRYRPRAFLIEILSFAWDESVSDPYRIRFNFRCKVLQDLFWKIDDKVGFTPNKGFAAAPGFGQGASVGGKSVPSIDRNGANYPLNISAQVGQIGRVLENFFPSLQQPTYAEQTSYSGSTNSVLNTVLGMTGLGQNQVAQKLLNQGQSLFSRQSIPIYPSGTVEQRDDVVGILTDLLNGSIVPQAPSGGQTVEVGGFSVPVLSLSQSVQDINLQDLKL
ncbi:hypothetical protein [Leptothoe spongobia]|uniref:Uncharacterized protein n=1 Tax=Leptothoe spongobia TAU-MAC 1115 TaxID=1967444 RepID=A0A947DFV5_9CYAN|nr:hypothetical protein [Leptothoe spongobia]MBT9316283.1 hypothetical protein [Leptothoe spongobia TAU-MAC 1115]